MSSSPEQQDFLGLHIRSVGTWTNKLYDFVEERTKSHKKSIDMAEKRLQLELPGGADDTSAKEIESRQETAVTIERNMDRNDKKLEVHDDLTSVKR